MGKGSPSLEFLCRKFAKAEEEEESRAAHVGKNNSKIDQTIRLNITLNLLFVQIYSII